jgi:hypothetical protein
LIEKDLVQVSLPDGGPFGRTKKAVAGRIVKTVLKRAAHTDGTIVADRRLSMNPTRARIGVVAACILVLGGTVILAPGAGWYGAAPALAATQQQKRETKSPF